MGKSKLFVPILACCLLFGSVALAACSKGEPTQPTKDTYTVSYSPSADYQINGLKESYKAKETVSFSVNVINELKKLSYVKKGSETLTANDSGIYSFEMPAEDVALEVRLTNKVAPKFVATYNGKTEVGQTIVISTTIGGEANDTFTVAATKGETLVTIQGHNVTLNDFGKVELEITAKSGPFDLSDTITFVISPNESSFGKNIAYDSGKITSGIESESRAKAGQWLYWSGDGGSISSFTYNNGEYEMYYTASGWAFHSVQLFFSLPYPFDGNSYHLFWDVYSDAVGQITISDNIVDLNVGNNAIYLPLTHGAAATVSVQMGYMEGKTHFPFGGSVFRFSPVRIYDADSTHTYHQVRFTHENELLKGIQVLDGRTVAAPEEVIIQGKILEGYYDGEVKYSSELLITKDYNFVAKYVEKTAENTKIVSVYLGNEKIDEVEVTKGNPVNLSHVKLAMGKTIAAVYTDAGLTEPFALNTPINENINLYLKLEINFDNTWINDKLARFPDEWINHEEDGTIVVSFEGWASINWHVQGNFTNFPIGEVGEIYSIDFIYSINQVGADASIWDGDNVATIDLEVGEKLSGHLEYNGGMLTGNRKLTFELGATDKVDVVFKLHEITVTKND